MIPGFGGPLQQKKPDATEWENRLVGKVFLRDGEETPLSAHEVVRPSDLPGSHRVLPPNSMMTMDYRTDRLNVHLDNTGRISTVNYG